MSYIDLRTDVMLVINRCLIFFPRNVYIYLYMCLFCGDTVSNWLSLTKCEMFFSVFGDRTASAQGLVRGPVAVPQLPLGPGSA